MSKFKVGDRVLIRRPKDINEEPFWDVSAMDHLHERVATIIGFDDDGWLRIDRERWVLSDAWCELVIHDDPTTLTRRDRFAMAALTGLIGNSEGVHAGAEPIISYLGRSENASWLAKTSFILADAMEAARNKEGAE